ncbi:hypothetical protein LZG04_12365 [Saccharothrix sp. S26]|nr:hypothetical protein [Saccharothrix sp. S26]MCE6995587.1 hypothetical protein [Saccharothrix sp. S26]
MAPEWPDPRKPQQFHLDIGVKDLGVARAEVLRLGGVVGRIPRGVVGVRRSRRAPVLPGVGVRVSGRLRSATRVRRWCPGSGSPSR